MLEEYNNRKNNKLTVINFHIICRQICGEWAYRVVKNVKICLGIDRKN